ncbi:MAG: N-acetylmuramoyl-L-alanine amidase [Pseudomonas sp.]|nr:N-acetylmuramoyl-L-alanine amidase [Pseudomonas sp.]
MTTEQSTDTTQPRLKDRERTELIVVHCSATQAKADIGKREITQWHRERGFDTIGYHYVIRRNGEVETGRRESEIGAHVRGYNLNSIGVCLVGGVDGKNKPENNFGESQFNALETVLHELKDRYPNARIVGHRDLSPDLNGDGKITPNEYIKACPSFDVGAWLSGRVLGG